MQKACSMPFSREKITLSTNGSETFLQMGITITTVLADIFIFYELLTEI